jgi:hypothetical protein
LKRDEDDNEYYENLIKALFKMRISSIDEIEDRVFDLSTDLSSHVDKSFGESFTRGEQLVTQPLLLQMVAAIKLNQDL